jgi:hypothetical protein
LNLSSAVNTRRTYERCCDDLRVIDNIFSFIENEKIDLDIHRLKLIEFFISLSVKSFVFNLGLNKINIKKNKAIDDLNSAIKKIENYNIKRSYQLTDDDVHAICKLLVENEKSLREIADLFEVRYGVIQRIYNKTRRKEISDLYDFSHYNVGQTTNKEKFKRK